MREKRGITLVALVVTIIVLLILAGVSISLVLGNNGILNQASKAVTKTNESKVQEQLEMEVASWVTEKYAGSGKNLSDTLDNTKYEVVNNGDGTYKVKDKETGYEFTVEDNGKVTLEKENQGEINKTLASVVKVGDYVAYEPTSTSWNWSDSENGNTYAAYSGSSNNTELTTESLSWRVLDIVDRKVRLISDVPTTSSVYLGGANGYNNAVYLIDKICSKLYSRLGIGAAQNLKIEDIEKYLTYDYKEYSNPFVDTQKYGGTKEYTSNRYYPDIFANEKMGWVNSEGEGELYISKQNALVIGSTQADSKIKVTQTDWNKSLDTVHFKDSIYYTLFVNNGSDYIGYYMSSRCIHAAGNVATFRIWKISYGGIGGDYLFVSDNTKENCNYKIRPVISMEADILVNTSDSAKDGSSQAKAWELK